jgi:hypothetical protein
MFAQQVLKFTKLTENRLRTVVIESVAKLATKVVKATPIDLPVGWHDPNSVGYARGGWCVSFNGPSSRLTGRLDPSGEDTITKIRSELQNYRITSHSTVHLNNNVPYIGTLEFGGYIDFVNRLKSTPEGFSTQAPAGMARLSSFLWPTFVNSAVSISRVIK